MTLPSRAGRLTDELIMTSPRIAACPELGFKRPRSNADVTRMEYVSRCPACSALVRRDQDWCTLCHEDLRPPELRPSAAAQPGPEAESPEPADISADPLLAASSVLVDERPSVAPAGKHARVSTTPVSPEAAAPVGKLDDAEIEALIVQLAAESPDAVSGLMSRLPETQSMRVILALMVGGVLATLLVGLSYLLGIFVN